MPPEWAPHDRTWMAWPGPNPTFASAAELDEARRAWAAVAHAVRRFEPVTMVVGPGQEDSARALLGPDIELAVRPLDDAWMRDIGPTFVTDGHELAAVDWTFNGWGAQGWARWERDRHIARSVAGLAGVPVHGSPLVNEGGAIHVDGEGTVLLTETVQLGRERNPGWSREQVEAEVHARLGTEKAIWLPRGLSGDYGTYGTLGHVDIVAAFVRPGTVVAHVQPDPAHPDHGITRETVRILRAATDAKGRALEVVEVLAPTVLRAAWGVGRLLLHQPLPLQRRRRPVRLRRPARRARRRDLPPPLPHPYGDTRRCPRDLRRGRRHPLHHPATAQGLNRAHRPTQPQHRPAPRGRARRRHGHRRRARPRRPHDGRARPRGRHEQRPPPLLLPHQGRTAAPDAGMEREPARGRAARAAVPARHGP